MKKTVAFACISLFVGIAAGVVIRPLFGSKHNCRKVVASFHVNNAEDFAFWVQQLSAISASDDKGNLVAYRVPGKKIKVPGYTLEQSRPLTIPDHHGYCTLHLVRVDKMRATIAYQWRIDGPGPSESLSSGVIEVPVAEIGGKP